MTSPDTGLPATDVPAEIAALRSPGTDPVEPDLSPAELADRFSRFYAPIAVILGLVAFLPPYTWGGSIFELIDEPAGYWALLGVVLVGVLVGLLSAAAWSRRTSMARQFWIIGLSLLTAVLVIVKPGFGLPAPHLSPSGIAAVVLLVATSCIGALHAGTARDV